LFLTVIDQLELLDYFESFRVLFIFVSSIVLWSVLLDKGSEDTDLVIKVFHKLKAVLLAESKLAEIVVETLLGHANHICGLDQTDLDSVNALLMEGAPFLDTFNNLSNCSLFVAFFLKALFAFCYLSFCLVPVVENEGVVVEKFPVQ
jgi:hypothetical protein